MPRLSTADRHQFDELGFVVVEDILDPVRDIQPLLDEYAAVLDGIAAALCSAGEIDSTYAGVPFDARLIDVCRASRRNFPQHFDFSLPQDGIRHDTPFHAGPAVFRILTSPRLLDVVEELIGPEIYANPVQHIRMKLPPRAVAEGNTSSLSVKTPWHQDNGVILPEADSATILTVWIPLNDATVDNGCLQVLPRSHRDGLFDHCPGSQGAAIPTQVLPRLEPLPLPMRAGSALLMTQRTVHSSLENRTSDQVRFSLDLRYQPVGQPSGRPMFPGFIARSIAHPRAVLRDPAEWARLWFEARARLAEREKPSFNRWRSDAPFCA
jgi:phytanoyl-CoA hydroxylase